MFEVYAYANCKGEIVKGVKYFHSVACSFSTKLSKYNYAKLDI